MLAPLGGRLRLAIDAAACVGSVPQTMDRTTPRFALFLVSLGLALGACSKAPAETPTTDPASATPAAEDAPEAEVVLNVDAQPGDTTTCPYSGRTFVVKAEDPKVEYEGKSYWVCSEKAAEAVRADPEKYFADFEG